MSSPVDRRGERGVARLSGVGQHHAVESKAVAKAWDVAQRGLEAARSQRCSREADGALQRGLGHVDAWPQRIEQFVLGHDASGMAYEIADEAQNQWLHREGLATEP